MSRRGRRRAFKLDFSIHPETQKGIFTVFLFFAAILILLSIFGVAGSLGAWVDQGVSQIFGWDKLFVPFFLFAWGYHLANPQKLPLNASNFIGFILFFLGLNGLSHIVTFSDQTSLITNEALRDAAGKLGQLLADPARGFLGVAGAMTLFACLFVVSLLLMFNTSIRTVLGFLYAIWKVIMWIGKKVVAFLNWIFRKREKKVEDYHATHQAEEEEEEEARDEGRGTSEDSIQKVPRPASGIVPGVSATVEAASAPKMRKRRPKIMVPIDLLQRRDDKPTSGDIDYNREVIRKTLKNFGIEVEMGEVAVGPTVTQFTFKPADGVKLTRVTALHNDLAMALAAHPIRIEAPIPGKALVGIEVPNRSVALVGLREMLESRAYQEKEKRFAIPFPLGKDVSGYPSVVDLSRMPHMLVAGATGAGKSVCLNILISSLLYAHGPDDLKMILVDPKRVEFPVYNGIPHLIAPVITKTEETVNALKWTIREMDRRFDVLSSVGARDIFSYNERSREKLPYLLFIVDELADLMVTSGAEVEGPIVRIAQLARAVGIHLILATQRPSVDVLTGLIKANIPARVAFSVASSTDSRTILDQTGAEKLLGRGDMLYQTAEMAAPKRVQGAYVSDDEVRRVVDFLKTSYGPPEYEEGVTTSQRGGGVMGGASSSGGEDSDPLLEDAMEEIVRAGKASASLLQRRLKVGYARAARILDLLEQAGMIGPGDGAKPREILKTDFVSPEPVVSWKQPVQVPSSVEPVIRAEEEELEEEAEFVEDEEIEEEPSAEEKRG
jgi:S-DNA-T family DNA segregation ATPase FtsK/SpoIIIE